MLATQFQLHPEEAIEEARLAPSRNGRLEGRSRCRPALPPGREAGKFPTESDFAHFREASSHDFNGLRSPGAKKRIGAIGLFNSKKQSDFNDLGNLILNTHSKSRCFPASGPSGRPFRRGTPREMR